MKASGDNESENKGQRARFTETARELGADQDPDALDRVFRKVVPPVTPKPAQKNETGI